MDRNELIRQIQDRFREAGESFNELQRRHWAAREAIQFGHGGITLVSKALSMSPNTVKRGIREITTSPADLTPAGARIRKSGGGRKPKRTLSVRSTRTTATRESTDGALDDGADHSQKAQDVTSASATGAASTALPHSGSEKRRSRRSEAL
jgi:hypothetical protein